MANFVKLAATAKRLIDANGRAISIVKLTLTPSDSDKPWRGPVDARSPAALTVTGLAAFVPLGGNDLGLDFQDAAPESRVCLFPASDDGGNALEDFDEIIDGTERYAIDRVQVLQPAATRLLYAFLVQA